MFIERLDFKYVSIDITNTKKIWQGTYKSNLLLRTKKNKNKNGFEKINSMIRAAACLSRISIERDVVGPICAFRSRMANHV